MATAMALEGNMLMQQALVRSTAPLVHDDAAGDSGLNQLQIWRDDSGATLTLFAVTNRADAEAWLQAQLALGKISTSEFIRTA